MIIKKFNEYKKFDVSYFNNISFNEFYGSIEKYKSLKLNTYEYQKINKISKFIIFNDDKLEYQYVFTNTEDSVFFYPYYKILGSKHILHIEFFKTDDDYFFVSFFYKENIDIIYARRYFIKCDGLSELIKLLKFITSENVL